jgi:very-short-patch-repair endonuclease
MRDLADSPPGKRRQNLPRDQIVAELSQDGVVSLRQLESVGISESAVMRSLRAGRLHLVLPGVYAVGHPTLSWRGKLRAALLWCGEEAVLSHMTAASLRELLRSSSGLVHVTIPRGGKTSHKWVRVHHTRHLAEWERTQVNGLAITSIERTLVDIAAEVSQDRLEQALIRADRSGQLDWAALRRSARGKPNTRKLHAVIAAFDPLAPQANEGIERTFLRLIRKARLPKPEVNVWIHNHEVDFLWRERRLIVELDSREFHLTPTAFENDRRRDIALQALGYTVLRITHRRLNEEPAAVIRELRYFLSGGGGGPCEP